MLLFNQQILMVNLSWTQALLHAYNELALLLRVVGGTRHTHHKVLLCHWGLFLFLLKR